MKFKRSIDVKHNVDMTPMVDIVFLLIIFFMVTTTYVKTSGMKVNLPKSVTSDPHPKNDMVISIDHSGEIYMGKKKVTLNDLQKVLKKEKDKTGRNVLIIKGDKNIKYRVLVEVMDKAKIAGIEKISLATGRRK